MSLNENLQRQLLALAKASIAHGLQTSRPLPIDLSELPEALRETRATFVTLQIQGQLRGCIGRLEAERPLAVDIADNAFAAAFRDPRFPPLQESELDSLEIHLSLLSPAEPMHYSSEDDLISQMRPGIDGLILQEGAHRGTFLPSVWESLSDPRQFLRHLKQKAGLPPDYWSETLTVSRYTAEYIG